MPFIGLGLIVAGAVRTGIDYVALLMPPALLFLALAVFKYDFLNLKTLARDAVFENSADAMLLTDANHFLIDYNRAAASIFFELEEKAKGESISAIFQIKHDFLSVYKSGRAEDLELSPGKHFDMWAVEVKTHSVIISVTWLNLQILPIGSRLL